MGWIEMEAVKLNPRLLREFCSIPFSLTGFYRAGSCVKGKLTQMSALDGYLLFVRLLTVAGGLLYYLFTGHEYSASQVFAWLFPLYVFYSLLLCAAIGFWPHAIRRLYLATLIVDMLFLFVLILFVGLFVGSFFMGFYLLVAISSFYFGLWAGLMTAVAASLLYGYLYAVLDGISLIPWPDFLVRIGFLFMISLSLGLISESVRRQRDTLAGALHQASLSGRLKDEFLTTISHEFRTPLTHVMGYAEILLDGRCRELSPACRTVAEKIFESGQDLLALFNRLVIFSRMKSGNAPIAGEPIELRGLLWEIIEELRPRGGNGHVKLDLDYPTHPVVVQSDRTLVHQVVSNLVSNALKFTDKGSVQVRLLNGDSASAVRIVVEDTGMGIQENELRAIFEEFRKGSDAWVGSKAGVGLGLAIVQNSLRRLGGEIHVESAYGRGSRFTVTLPKAFATETG